MWIWFGDRGPGHIYRYLRRVNRPYRIGSAVGYTWPLLYADRRCYSRVQRRMPGIHNLRAHNGRAPADLRLGSPEIDST